MTPREQQERKLKMLQNATDLELLEMYQCGFITMADRIHFTKDTNKQKVLLQQVINCSFDNLLEKVTAEIEEEKQKVMRRLFETSIPLDPITFDLKKIFDDYLKR